MESPKGKIYLVPTPIGNVGDITRRAVETLGDVDIIACEDTRRSGSLFKKLGIDRKRLVSYHDFNERYSAGLK
jgi:16S rRNA (cytidine1402-2'-O)-methyltransferase